jgi:hypothetical protein
MVWRDDWHRLLGSWNSFAVRQLSRHPVARTVFDYDLERDCIVLVAAGPVADRVRSVLLGLLSATEPPVPRHRAGANAYANATAAAATATAAVAAAAAGPLVAGDQDESKSVLSASSVSTSTGGPLSSVADGEFSSSAAGDSVEDEAAAVSAPLSRAPHATASAAAAAAAGASAAAVVSVSARALPTRGTAAGWGWGEPHATVIDVLLTHPTRALRMNKVRDPRYTEAAM